MAEMLATIEGSKFVERVSVNNPANVRKAKKAIMRAFQCQIEGKGFSFVEVLSTCPTNWGKTPINALKWLEENMIPYYPLGNLKDFE
jgi:2-oxoglutarate ferredoxin oxidoreductase subunit beta